MSKMIRSLLVVVAASVTLLLMAGPAPAVQGEEPPTLSGTSAPEGEGGGRMKLPLDLEDPEDLVGLGILIATGVGVALAVSNMFKQLRGERPQATGRWRPR